MPEAEGDGDVKVILIFPLKHEEWPIQGVGPELLRSTLYRRHPCPYSKIFAARVAGFGSLSLKGAPSREFLGMPELTLAS